MKKIIKNAFARGQRLPPGKNSLCRGGFARMKAAQTRTREFANLHSQIRKLTLANSHIHKLVSQTRIKPMHIIKIGSQAPDFTLKSKTAAGIVDIKLSDNFGKKQTVVLFFPLAFTSVCTQEMCDTSGGLADYDNLGADVIAISVDSPFAQEVWAKANGITVKLASDLDKTAASAYGVLLKDLMGLGRTAARAAFVVSKDGIIKYAEQTATPGDLPNFAAIKAALAR